MARFVRWAPLAVGLLLASVVVLLAMQEVAELADLTRYSGVAIAVLGAVVMVPGGFEELLQSARRFVTRLWHPQEPL